MQAMKKINSQFSQYNGEFELIAAGLNWNPLALTKFLRIRWSKVLKDYFQYCNLQEDMAKWWQYA